MQRRRPQTASQAHGQGPCWYECYIRYSVGHVRGLRSGNAPLSTGLWLGPGVGRGASLVIWERLVEKSLYLSFRYHLGS